MNLQTNVESDHVKKVRDSFKGIDVSTLVELELELGPEICVQTHLFMGFVEEGVGVHLVYADTTHPRIGCEWTLYRLDLVRSLSIIGKVDPKAYFK